MAYRPNHCKSMRIDRPVTEKLHEVTADDSRSVKRTPNELVKLCVHSVFEGKHTFFGGVTGVGDCHTTTRPRVGHALSAMFFTLGT